MAAITVPNTFSNGTAADATAVNANFDAITDGLSDGTKDITVSAATINGALTANGAVTLGNATGDDIIVTGRVAADFDPKTASTYDMGDATQLWKGVYANDAFLDRGAVGTPSHSFHLDTDTGMWSSAANTLDFATNGVNQLSLTTAVAHFTQPIGSGISPATQMHAHVAASADCEVRVENDDGTWGMKVNSTGNFVIRDVAGGDDRITIIEATGQVVFPSAAVNTGGSLGVGTSSPSTVIHALVSGSNDTELRLENGDATWGVKSKAAGNFVIRDVVSGDDRVTIVESTGQMVVTEARAIGGVIIGTSSEDNRIDDSSSGTGSTTLYIGDETIDTTVVSDKRVKDVAGPTTRGLKDVLAWLMVDFNWNENSTNKDKKTLHIGGVAQDIWETHPDLVAEGNDYEAWRIRYNKTIPYIIRAVQQLDAKIEALMPAPV